jgi:hypothetical protein
MLRALMLLILMIPASGCVTILAGPVKGDDAWVPCSSLFPVRHSPRAIEAMSDPEVRETLANAEVIRIRCGK